MSAPGDRGPRAVERGGVARGRGLERVDDLLERELEPRGELAGRRRPPELGAELAVGGHDPLGALLQLARRPDAPCVVAEVALDLAGHGRHGVGAEGDPALGLVAVDRLHQPDGGDLDEILELVEMKKNSFWNKIFKQGGDKKGVKKKGTWPMSVLWPPIFTRFPIDRCLRRALGTAG